MSEVLALKYRPKNFDTLIGQDSITQTLSLALNNKRLSHAYLFSGLRGSGKTSTARIFSKALVCDHGPTSTPCEKCENCIMANENRHIDIIEMDAASSRKIDDIRDLIEQTKYKPNVARYKIFIIDEVHMLTREAFNALLKTLEEPPPYIKFILATTDPLKLPATILSRTQHFRFKQIAQTDVINHLGHILNEEKIAYDEEALSMISRAGNGSLRDSLTLLDQAIIYTKSSINPEDVASMLGLLDSKKLDEIFQNIFNEDKDAILKSIQELETYECEVIIDELIAYVKDKFYQKSADFSTLISERFFRILSEAKGLLFLNADSGFVLSLVFFKMLEALNIKRVDEMISSLEKEKFTKKEPVNAPQEPMPQSEEVAEKPAIDATTNTDKFGEFIKKLYDRNYELGSCFEQNVKFISFENSVLLMQSQAKDECQKTLRNSSGVIKHFVQDVFGIDAKISMKQPPQQNEEVKKKSALEELKEQIASSMDNLTKNETSEELGEEDKILQEKLPQKIRETFSLKKITIIKK